MNHDARKKQCDLLAEKIAGDETLHTLRLLEATGFFGRVESRETSRQEVSQKPISIWQPIQTPSGLVYRRPEPLSLGDHYSTRITIEAVAPKGTRRICFFGESVAAGYLYAPHLTPARVMQHQLDHLTEPGSHDVIDLARTNETLDSLLLTVEQSLALNPDVLVVFVGNNWNLLETPDASPYTPSHEARQQYATRARGGGLENVIDEAGETLLRKASSALDRLARLAGDRPLILIIPEVNLLDWESRQPVSWLPGDGVSQWYQLHDEVSKHLEAGRFDDAERDAMAMLNLDGGVCSTTYRLIARARMGNGAQEAALKACRAEVDSVWYASICFLEAPRATTMARKLLRRKADLHGLITVDAAEVIVRNGKKPDRNMFADYCHLTAEGMDLVMGAVTGIISSRQNLVANLPATPLDSRAEATALFGAAIHSAHRLVSTSDRLPYLTWWCRKALQCDPETEQVMLDFIAARLAPCPAVLTAAQQRNAASPAPLMLQHGWRYDFLDAEVILAVREALKDKPETRKAIDAMIRDYPVDQNPTLLWPFFTWNPLEQFYPEIMDFEDLTKRAYFRAAWPRSSFCVIVRPNMKSELSLTIRTPYRRGKGRLILTMDGVEAGLLETTPEWQIHCLELTSHTKSPLAKLTLHWPMPDQDGRLVMEEAVNRLEMGREADLHPVFGEISRAGISYQTRNS